MELMSVKFVVVVVVDVFDRIDRCIRQNEKECISWEFVLIVLHRVTSITLKRKGDCGMKFDCEKWINLLIGVKLALI